MVAACAREGVAIVPQGGNTGLSGGSVPTGTRREVVLSLGRMNRIRAIDVLNDTLTVEAGCVLAAVQRAADEAGRLFALSLAAEGSCQIGGNLSTNAGGVNVLRYGNAREQVLGLEVVLPDGRVWDGLRGPAQGQHRLRPEAAFPRRRGNAGRSSPPRCCGCTRSQARLPPPGSALASPRAQRSSCSRRCTSGWASASAPSSSFRGNASKRCLKKPEMFKTLSTTPYPWYVLAEVGRQRIVRRAAAAPGGGARRLRRARRARRRGDRAEHGEGARPLAHPREHPGGAVHQRQARRLGSRVQDAGPDRAARALDPGKVSRRQHLRIRARRRRQHPLQRRPRGAGRGTRRREPHRLRRRRGARAARSPPSTAWGSSSATRSPGARIRWSSS